MGLGAHTAPTMKTVRVPPEQKHHRDWNGIAWHSSSVHAARRAGRRRAAAPGAGKEAQGPGAQATGGVPRDGGGGRGATHWWCDLTGLRAKACE